MKFNTRLTQQVIVKDDNNGDCCLASPTASEKPYSPIVFISRLIWSRSHLNTIMKREHPDQAQADWRNFQRVCFDPSSGASSTGDSINEINRLGGESTARSGTTSPIKTLTTSASTNTTSNILPSKLVLKDLVNNMTTTKTIKGDNEGVSTAKNTITKTSDSGVGGDNNNNNNQKQSIFHGKENARHQQGAKAQHPLDAASLISKLFFGWMFPFILRGWRSGLKRTDMPSEPSAAESCHKIGEKLVANWTKELESCNYLTPSTTRSGLSDLYLRPPQSPQSKRRPSLARVVVKTHAKWILLNSLFTFFAEVVCKSLSAYSVGQMLLHMSKRELVDYSRLWSLEDPLVFWTISLVFAVCSWALTAHFYGFQMMRVGLHVRVGCSYLIYRKSLKLGQYESSQTTMGRMINLLSNDLDKFNYVCIMVPFLWIGPIQTVVSLYLLWPTLGPACLGSILVLSVLTPIQFYLSRKFASFRGRIAAYTDERVRLLNETITALKLIKLYGWEYSFRAAMAESRRRETDLINRVGIIKGISVAFMYVSSKLVLFVTIIFHCVLFGGSLDPQTLFMSMAMLNNVQFTMTQLMPRVVSLGVESLVSLQRITDFLLTKEFLPSDKLRVELVHNEVVTSDSVFAVSFANKAHDTNKLMPRQTDLNKRTAFVDCQNVGASWPGAETKTIDGVSFRCESPGLIIICGQVASGKTSLFMSLLNELPISEGKTQIHGSCGYSSQTAWIFNGTVRDNIIFGYGYNERRYQRVLEVCALKRDMELLEYGDFTYIQENSLSGGQKARVNLARCLYRECDIYFLDDPFSAIDGQVAEHIFEEAIKKFLSKKLVLLATHRVGLMKGSDKVLFLDEGRQLAYCDYEELRVKLSNPSTATRHFTCKQLGRLSFIKENFEYDSANVDDDCAGGGGDIVGAKTLKNTISKEDKLGLKSDSSSKKSIVKKVQGDHNTANKIGCAGNNEPNEVQENSVAVCTSYTREEFLVEGGKKLSQSTVNENYQIHDENKRTILIQQNQQEQKAGCLIGDCDRTRALGPATSGSIHAPYGWSKFVGYEDKTLIAVQEANSHPLQTNPIPKSMDCSLKRGSLDCGEGQLANKVEFDRRTMDTAQSHYRTTKNRCQQSDSVQGYNLTKKSTHQQPREHFRSRNGPADEETSSSKLPGLRAWYKYYTQTSVIRLVFIILTFLITQALFSTVDIYLTVWSLIEQNKALVNEITGFNQQQLATFKHQANINQHRENNRSNIIEYDLMVGGESPLLVSLSLAEYNYTNREIEMAQEIQKISISPLSSRSSQLPFVMPMNNFFVPMVDLFYTADSTANYYPSNASQQQQQRQQQQYQQQKHRHQITSSTTKTALAYDSVMVDGNIFEESEAALNVKSIYRPLYLFVNNFTSGHHALTYTILLMALFSCSAITNVLSLTSSNKSAISLYRKLTDNALFAKLAFFDRNPVGRFLNRATRDIGIIDEAIPYNANQAYDALLQTAATFIVVAAVDINLALPSLIILFIFLIFHSIHVKPTKDIQRLEGISRSPIISHISTTLAGLHTIRATKSEHRFEQLFIKHQDAHTSIFLLYLGCNRSMAVVLDSLNATYTGIIAFWAVVSGLSGPSAGLVITSAMLLSGLTQHGVMKLTETESLMTSVERVIEYCSLPQEENYDRRRRDRRPNGINRNRIWPNEGSVEYRHVDLYYNKLEKPVLKNISFKLNAGEKVGIVGRTGAGKSSIITTLFRLYDFEGTILIDGVDIKKVDLIELRTAIGIIPQNPILFSTSIRQNLDPLNVYDDFSLWTALDKAHLRETVSALPGKLDYNIGSGGGFSSGQKQLICLARVLLRQSSLIVMDEATANIDPATDAIIQTTIRCEFKHCTVITIAHRLETILDCDRIMVLEAGRIVDFDTPEQLVAKSNNYLTSLLHKSSEE